MLLVVVVAGYSVSAVIPAHACFIHGLALAVVTAMRPRRWKCARTTRPHAACTAASDLLTSACGGGTTLMVVMPYLCPGHRGPYKAPRAAEAAEAQLHYRVALGMHLVLAPLRINQASSLPSATVYNRSSVVGPEFLGCWGHGHGTCKCTGTGNQEANSKQLGASERTAGQRSSCVPIYFLYRI